MTSLNNWEWVNCFLYLHLYGNLGLQGLSKSILGLWLSTTSGCKGRLLFLHIKGPLRNSWSNNSITSLDSILRYYYIFDNILIESENIWHRLKQKIFSGSKTWFLNKVSEFILIAASFWRNAGFMFFRWAKMDPHLELIHT